MNYTILLDAEIRYDFYVFHNWAGFLMVDIGMIGVLMAKNI